MISVFRKYLLVFLFLSGVACAEVPKNILPLAEVEGDPSAIVAGCVNWAVKFVLERAKFSRLS